MNRRQAWSALAAVAGAPLAYHIAFKQAQPAPRQSLLIGGAGTMRSLMAALARGYCQRHPGLDVVIEQGGSLAAYGAASRGAIDLAAMTRGLSDAEDDAGARHYLIAKADVAVVINRALGLTDLSRQQIQSLLTGHFNNWRQVGGPDRKVKIYALADEARTSLFAQELVLDGSLLAVDASEFASSVALAEAVAADPAAIGYCASGGHCSGNALLRLAVDGVPASTHTVLSGRYPYALPMYLLLYGERDGHRAGFVDFARSAAGQRIVAREGLLAVC